MEAPQPTETAPEYIRLFDENQLTPQCRDLLPSLPSAESWLTGLFHQYQGYWFSSAHLNALLYDREHFQARNSDVFLITVPKSGTTWLKAILFALVNRTKFPPTSPDHPLLSNNPHDLILFLEYLKNPDTTPDPEAPQRIFSTHTPWALLPDSVKESSCKVIFLCRNPKDVFVSGWLFANKLRGDWTSHRSLDEAFEKFCGGMTLGGPYWDNVLGHWKESIANPHRVMFLMYEDLKQTPGAVIRKVAEFLGCPLSADEESEGVVDEIIKLCSLKKLSSLEVNGPAKRTTLLDIESNTFFRKGKVGDWKNYLTPEMTARIDSITAEKFQGSGLSI